MQEQEIDIRKTIIDIWERWGLRPWLLVAAALFMALGLTWMLSLRSEPLPPPSYQATVLLVLDSPTSGSTLADIAPFLAPSTTITLAGDKKIIKITATAENPTDALNQADLVALRLSATARRMREREAQLKREAREALVRQGYNPLNVDPGMLTPNVSQVIDRIDQDVQAIQPIEAKGNLSRNLAVVTFIVGVLGVATIFGFHSLTGTSYKGELEA